jgi:hypothetical protein
MVLESGPPSPDTFSRLLRLLDPSSLPSAFGRFPEALGADGAGVIAIDGKTLRRSFDPAEDRSPLHVVTPFAAETHLRSTSSKPQGQMSPSGENESEPDGPTTSLKPSSLKCDSPRGVFFSVAIARRFGHIGATCGLRLRERV